MKSQIKVAQNYLKHIKSEISNPNFGSHLRQLFTEIDHGLEKVSDLSPKDMSFGSARCHLQARYREKSYMMSIKSVISCYQNDQIPHGIPLR